jgi:hypothetical protein
MRPEELKERDFVDYPPRARKVAIEYLATLQRMQLSLLPAILRDLRELDWKFPPEEAEIRSRLEFCRTSAPGMELFKAILVPDALAKLPWVTEPQHFLEQFTSYLWSSRQMDAYRQASTEFVQEVQTAVPVRTPSGPRLVTVMIGRDAAPSAYPLFQKLLPHGQLLTHVDSTNAASMIMETLSARVATSPGPYAHWYIDGGNPLTGISSGVTQLTYPSLMPMRQRILERMSEAIQVGSGPEALGSELLGLSPAELAADKVTGDAKMQRLAVSVLTEASGTQIFSTSFVQWTAREVLRRAQPTTLCVRFAPRQRQQDFNAMVRIAEEDIETDPEGSLIDADMGAYYTYLEMQKLAGADSGTFLVYLEGRSLALAAGPEFPAGTTYKAPSTLTQILRRQIKVMG